MVSLISSAVEDAVTGQGPDQTPPHLVVIKQQNEYVALTRRRVGHFDARNRRTHGTRWSPSHPTLKESLLARALSLAPSEAEQLLPLWNASIRSNCYYDGNRIMPWLTAIVKRFLPDPESTWTHYILPPAKTNRQIPVSPPPATIPSTDFAWCLKPEMLGHLLLGTARDLLATHYGEGWCCAIRGVQDQPLRRALSHHALLLLQNGEHAAAGRPRCKFGCVDTLSDTAANEVPGSEPETDAHASTTTAEPAKVTEAPPLVSAVTGSVTPVSPTGVGLAPAGSTGCREVRGPPPRVELIDDHTVTAAQSGPTDSDATPHPPALVPGVREMIETASRTRRAQLLTESGLCFTGTPTEEGTHSLSDTVWMGVASQPETTNCARVPLFAVSRLHKVWALASTLPEPTLPPVDLAEDPQLAAHVTSIDWSEYDDFNSRSAVVDLEIFGGGEHCESIECMIDSGAGPSVISQELCNRVGITIYPLTDRERAKNSLYSATGHSINVQGKALVRHKFSNGAAFQYRCWVATGFDHPLLLGNDFLNKVGGIPNFFTHRFSAMNIPGMEGEGVPMHTTIYERNLLRVQGGTTVPPHSVAFVEVRADQSGGLPQWHTPSCTIEVTRRHGVDSDAGVVVATAWDVLTPREGQLVALIQVANPNAVPIDLADGYPVAQFNQPDVMKDSLLPLLSELQLFMYR